MLHTPFYNPDVSYEENCTHGPYGAFADGTVFAQTNTPKNSFFGIPVHLPFGIAAGPLVNGAFVKAALDKGFDIATYKTVRTRKYPCHPWPNVLSVETSGDLTIEKAQGKLVADRNYHEPLSITNSFGVPSFNPSFWQEDIANVVKNTRPGQVVVASFQGTKDPTGSVEAYINDYRIAARLLLETGVKILEVNLSCPNEGTSALLCYDTERSLRVVDAIKNEIGDVPLIIKTAYYSDHPALEEFVRKLGKVANGISSINTISAEIVGKDGAQALPGEGRARSGVCGHAIKWAGLEMTRRLKELRDTFGYTYTIIGVGGVTTPPDYKEYRAAGADAVMCATGAMWNPHLAREIKATL